MGSTFAQVPASAACDGSAPASPNAQEAATPNGGASASAPQHNAAGLSFPSNWRDLICPAKQAHVTGGTKIFLAPDDEIWSELNHAVKEMARKHKLFCHGYL